MTYIFFLLYTEIELIPLRIFSDTTSATTETIDFSDAPQLQHTLIMQLQNRSLWDMFKESVRGLSPDAILKRLNNEKERIMKDMDKRGYITKEEADFLNRQIEASLEEILEKFKQQARQQLKIQPGDKPEEVKFKMEFSNQLLKWLTDLFEWLIQKIKAIFAHIKEALDWCWQKTKDLFNYLFGLFGF
jgi:hypothetical protein